MLSAALEAEVGAYRAELVYERDEDGQRLVTRKRPRTTARDPDRGWHKRRRSPETESWSTATCSLYRPEPRSVIVPMRGLFIVND
jgi:hypothetical protein